MDPGDQFFVHGAIRRLSESFAHAAGPFTLANVDPSSLGSRNRLGNQIKAAGLSQPVYMVRIITPQTSAYSLVCHSQGEPDSLEDKGEGIGAEET